MRDRWPPLGSMPTHATASHSEWFKKKIKHCRKGHSFFPNNSFLKRNLACDWSMKLFVKFMQQPEYKNDKQVYLTVPPTATLIWQHCTFSTFPLATFYSHTWHDQKLRDGKGTRGVLLAPWHQRRVVLLEQTPSIWPQSQRNWPECLGGSIYNHSGGDAINSRNSGLWSTYPRSENSVQGVSLETCSPAPTLI